LLFSRKKNVQSHPENAKISQTAVNCRSLKNPEHLSAVDMIHYNFCYIQHEVSQEVSEV